MVLGVWRFLIVWGGLRKRNPLGPYRRPMPSFLGESQGGGLFLVGKVPLHCS